MSKNHLFIDGSYHPESKIGVGAYSILTQREIMTSNQDHTIHLNIFNESTSNKLELQTLIWALNLIKIQEHELLIYTDSQTIVDLPSRRERLLKYDFHSKAGRLLNNHEEYRVFFELSNRADYTFIKVKGHRPNHEKSAIDTIFSRIDKAARKHLRSHIKSL